MLIFIKMVGQVIFLTFYCNDTKLTLTSSDVIDSPGTKYNEVIIFFIKTNYFLNTINAKQ